MCQLLKLREKKMHQQYLRTKSNHLQQARLCTCLFSQDFDSTFRFWDIICWPSPMGLPTVYDATVSQLPWVLPSVSLTKDTTAGTSGSNTKRSPVGPSATWLTVRLSHEVVPVYIPLPSPPPARKALAPFPNIHANIWYSMWNCISPLF